MLRILPGLMILLLPTAAAAAAPSPPPPPACTSIAPRGDVHHRQRAPKASDRGASLPSCADCARRGCDSKPLAEPLLPLALSHQILA